MKNRVSAKEQRGASFVEYALLVALIAIVSLIALKSIGLRTSDSFVNASCEVAGRPGCQNGFVAEQPSQPSRPIIIVVRPPGGGG